MKRNGALVATTLAAVLSAWTAQAHAAQPSRATNAASARATVSAFFSALEAGKFRRACTLLGDELAAETRGYDCPSFLRFGAPRPLKWKITGSRETAGGVGIVVRLGQNELDHVRMRTWLAIVRYERGSPKIVETRLLA